ncbi:MAG TPA: YicC/YloC family endoribonuclease [Xylella taiwanensis]
MIHSMTAFAADEHLTPWGLLACELRSVNHRFLDIVIRLPEELRALELQLRERVTARVSRGKLDLTLRLSPQEIGTGLAVNEPLLSQLSTLALRLSGQFPALRVTFTELLQIPGVLKGEQIDTATLQAHSLALLDKVLDNFIATREREGVKLKAMIAQRASAIERIVSEVRSLIPTIRDGQHTKLTTRLSNLPYPVDPGRIEQELVLWLQKLDVDEELDRLSSHISELNRVLHQREPVGRRLDFLLQEFNREANTLGSKSVDSRTSNATIELKVLIDQIREQVQNLE